MEAIPKKEPLPGFRNYQVKLMAPWKIGSRRTAEIGEALYQGICTTPAFLHWVGPEFRPVTYEIIRQTILDPRERLRRRTYEAMKTAVVSSSLGNVMHSITLKKGNIAWGLFTKNEYDESIMVGFALWKVPKSMEQETLKRLRMDSIFFSIYKFIATIGRTILDRLMFWKYKSHPFRNNRMKSLLKDKDEKFPLFDTNSAARGDELSKMTYDQLVSEVYRPMDSLVLQWFSIDKRYKDQGLEQSFLEYMLHQIPSHSIEIVSRDGKHRAVGPQKVMIDFASDEQIPFYEKLGFEVTFRYESVTDEGYRIVAARMDMSR